MQTRQTVDLSYFSSTARDLSEQFEAIAEASRLEALRAQESSLPTPLAVQKAAEDIYHTQATPVFTSAYCKGA